MKADGGLKRMASAKEALTSARLSPEKGKWVDFFGLGDAESEVSVRQYLLLRVAGLDLNRAVLFAAGKSGGALSHPAPIEWRRLFRQYGFDVAERRSALLWGAFVALQLARGIYTILKLSLACIVELSRSRQQGLGRHVYFDTVTPSNLPRQEKGEDRESHDIVSWYLQWSGRAERLDSLCHGAKGVPPSRVKGLPLLSIPMPVQPLDQWGLLLRFLAWGVSSAFVALVDIFRGKWWRPVMLAEAAKAAQVRLLAPDRLARDYLFHNSSWIYRPLWTYDAERKGARVFFYFYSTNIEPFKQMDAYPDVPYGWRSMTWPCYLVWDKYQAAFVKRAVGLEAKICVVGPIWFNASPVALRDLPPGSVAVFDVQPMRDSICRPLGIDFEYYVPLNANQFLRDVFRGLEKAGLPFVFKRKRNVGKQAHSSYVSTVKALENSPNYLEIDPNVSAIALIEKCRAVISAPFTSTAILAREMGKPSIFYDPHGICHKDDRAAHGIEILAGQEELRAWLAALPRQS